MISRATRDKETLFKYFSSLLSKRDKNRRDKWTETAQLNQVCAEQEVEIEIHVPVVEHNHGDQQLKTTL